MEWLAGRRFRLVAHRLGHPLHRHHGLADSEARLESGNGQLPAVFRHRCLHHPLLPAEHDRVCSRPSSRSENTPGHPHPRLWRDDDAGDGGGGRPGDVPGLANGNRPRGDHFAGDVDDLSRHHRGPAVFHYSVPRPVFSGGGDVPGNSWLTGGCHEGGACCLRLRAGRRSLRYLLSPPPRLAGAGHAGHHRPQHGGWCRPRPHWLLSQRLLLWGRMRLAGGDVVSAASRTVFARQPTVPAAA